MGTCVFCGSNAGIFRKAHKDCQKRHDAGCNQILERAKRAISLKEDLHIVEQEIRDIASSSFIHDDELQLLLAQAWEESALSALEDDILTHDEEQTLDAFQEHFSLSQAQLDTRGTFTRLVKVALIRDLLEGNLDFHLRVKGDLPFNISKKEQLIWVFQDVDYYEQRTRTRYVGGYQGVSIRIARGFYYRVGGFRGNPIAVQETVHIGSGLLGVTNKHLYFAGSGKAFRIPYSRIVSFFPFNDGIGIQRDAMNARLQLFKTGDGWFTYNLIVNLAKLDEH